MYGLPIIELSAKEHLKVLRQLDRAHDWQSLREQRRCRACGDVFSGREIEIVGGTRGYGPLRLQCPTYRCGKGPDSWDVVLPAHLKTPTAPEGVKVTHGGRACTFRRIRHLDAQSSSTAVARTIDERIRAALRRVGEFLHAAPRRTPDSGTVLSHGLTRG